MVFPAKYQAESTVSEWSESARLKSHFPGLVSKASRITRAPTQDVRKYEVSGRGRSLGPLPQVGVFSYPTTSSMGWFLSFQGKADYSKDGQLVCQQKLIQQISLFEEWHIIPRILICSLESKGYNFTSCLLQFAYAEYSIHPSVFHG